MAGSDSVSIWGSLPGIDDDSAVGPPWVYDHSGVLPDVRRPRDGWVGIAHLCRFVRHYINHPGTTDTPDGVEPWLRLSVNEDAVVLDEAQVSFLVDRLTDWLDELRDSEATA